MRISSEVNVIQLYQWLVNINSGNGSMTSGNKPLPDPMLTQIDICHIKVSLGHYELIHLPLEQYPPTPI